MKATINEESYALVLKMAYKFAYGNTSLQYEKYVNDGLKGLEHAVNTYKEGNGTQFSTYANTCIRNAMCTSQKQINRFDLQQDENIEMGDIKTLTMEMVDDDMEDVLTKMVHKVNKNKRNAEMVLLHIGMKGEEPMDYKELSAKFNVSAERVRQVYTKTIAAIKSNAHDKELLYSFVG